MPFHVFLGKHGSGRFPLFTSVRSNKISEHIVEQVRRAIFEGRLKPGDRLPPERELTDHFGVSKATLREAMRSLEVLGLLEIRKGVAGGAVVTEVDAKRAKDSFTNFLLFKNVSVQDLAEIRLLLESHIAEKAARAIGAADLEKLRNLIDDCERLLGSDAPAATRTIEVEFHRLLAALTGNPILIFVLDFVENLLLDTKDILKPGKEFSHQVQKAHRRIYKALLARDVERTRTEMVRHVREVERDLIKLQHERKLPELTLHGMFQQGNGAAGPGTP